MEVGRRLAAGMTDSPCLAWGHLGFRTRSPTSWEILQVQATRTAALAILMLTFHQSSCPQSHPILHLQMSLVFLTPRPGWDSAGKLVRLSLPALLPTPGNQLNFSSLVC